MTFGCGSAPGNVRRDDVDVVPAATRFAREEVNVLAHPAEVRIVVLGDQRDAERPLVARQRKRSGDCGSAGWLRRARLVWSGGFKSGMGGG